MTRWKEIRLGDHLSFITSGSRGWSEYYASDGALFLRIQNVGYNELRLEDIAFVQPPDGAEARRTRVQPGDVLLSITADLGRTAVVPERLGTAHINQHLAILRVKDIAPHYLAAFLSLGPGRLQLQRLDRVGVKSGLNFDDVRSLRILLPPLPEQRRFMAILDKADAIHRKRIEAIHLADAFLKSVFLDMFGDPVANSNRWNSKPLEDFVEAERGISYGVVQRGADCSNGVPLIRINNILDNRLNHEGIVKADPAVEAKYRRTRLKGGKLLLSIRGTVGRITIAPDWATGWNVTREIAVIPLTEGINRDFVHYLMQTRGAQHFMTGEVRGVAQKGINLRDVRRLPVPMVPHELQNRFSILVKHFHEHQDRTNHSRNELDDLFNSLIQRAFRGEL